MSIQPIILAGGTGTRLWPLSRELYPKQVIKLIGDLSLLQNTLERAKGITDSKAPIIVVGEEHKFMTKNQIEAVGLYNKGYQILLEPVGRNTAAAICGAAAYCLDRGDGDDILLILPSDHLIADNNAFFAAVEKAARFAKEEKIVTFGIVPTRP